MIPSSTRISICLRYDILQHDVIKIETHVQQRNVSEIRVHRLDEVCIPLMLTRILASAQDCRAQQAVLVPFHRFSMRQLDLSSLSWYMSFVHFLVLSFHAELGLDAILVLRAVMYVCLAFASRCCDSAAFRMHGNTELLCFTIGYV